MLKTKTFKCPSSLVFRTDSSHPVVVPQIFSFWLRDTDPHRGEQGCLYLFLLWGNCSHLLAYLTESKLHPTSNFGSTYLWDYTWTENFGIHDWLLLAYESNVIEKFFAFITYSFVPMHQRLDDLSWDQSNKNHLSSKLLNLNGFMRFKSLGCLWPYINGLKNGMFNGFKYTNDDVTSIYTLNKNQLDFYCICSS